MNDVLRSEVQGGVLTLTLNRPEKRNSLSAELVEALICAFDGAAQQQMRLVVIRGEGPAFCAGFDFSGLEGQSDGDLVLRFIRIELLLQQVYYAPFATLGLAHGSCYGAGADLLCACDWRVAADGTNFRMPGLRFGIVLGTGRLLEIVGADDTRALLETSPVFKSQEALERGFLNEVAEPETWQGIIARAAKAATDLPDDAHQQLCSLTKRERGDADLTALVRSASRPGLKARIAAFQAGSKA